MASIQVRKGRANYCAVFRVNRRQRCRSTGIPHTPAEPAQRDLNKGRAQARADQMERTARAKVSKPDLATKIYLERFATTRTNDVDTARRTQNVVNRFISLLGDQAAEPVTVVAHAHILLYRDARAPEIEASTVNSELSILHVAFEAAVEQGILHMNPVNLKRDELPETSSVRPLDDWEVEALLLATLRVDWRTCIYIGYYTACQFVDAGYRRWSDVQKDESGQWFLSFPGNERKAAKMVLIHPALLAHLNCLRRANEFICPGLAELERWTNDNHFAKIVSDAKLGPGVTFRCLRHTHAKKIRYPIKRIDMAGPEALLELPDIRVSPLPCQLPTTLM